MKRLIIIISSIILVCSCGGSGSKSGNKQNYLEREVSTYSTGASGIDEKIVFHRSTKQYEYYTRAALYDSSNWELEDSGHYTESIGDDNIVTCKLDNARIKGEEKLGTIRTVKIDLESRTARFISIVGDSIAKELFE